MPIQKRPIRIDGNIAYVPLPHGREAIIDAEDAELVGQHNWHFQKNGYVMSQIRLANGKQHRPYLHRVVMGDPIGMDVDHKHGNKLDNRKSELRICTTSENCRNQRMASHNTSGLKGASWNKQNQRWLAKIQHLQKYIFIGYFPTAEEAHAAYCQAAKLYHGEFARTA